MRECLVTLAIVLLFAESVRADAEPVGLKATLSSTPAGAVRVVFLNGTDRDVKIDKQVLACGTLALEVRDAAGKVLPTIPPPVPAAKQEFFVLGSGKEVTRTYELNIFSPPLAPGVYRVRIPWTDWKSNELHHRVSE